MNESDKAVVRQFLASNSGKAWIENGVKGCPKLDLAKTNIENYNASLLIKEGWTEALKYLANSVEEQPVQEYGVKPIDTVAD